MQLREQHSEYCEALALCLPARDFWHRNKRLYDALVLYIADINKRTRLDNSLYRAGDAIGKYSAKAVSKGVECSIEIVHLGALMRWLGASSALDFLEKRIAVRVGTQWKAFVAPYLRKKNLHTALIILGLTEENSITDKRFVEIP